MYRRRLYYSLKPFLNVRMRRAVRSAFARRLLPKVRGVWPILESAGKPPPAWMGWPDGKDFAFVLTHDVESAEGLSKCRQLAELEMRYGFRSSFNFIPEGPYQVPSELRDWLTRSGFEVGVHDLHHDGKLYSSREHFSAKAQGINRYLQAWNAVGYRSGFMFHNLDWQHDLDILYDASTFDTDPFEPQPDGVGTIFPSWVRHPGAPTGETPGRNHADRGYIELPYTLVQDSTLFFLLRERSTRIWTDKLSWIVRHGGMALLNTHPDYMEFGAGKSYKTFPAALYGSFLAHVADSFPHRYYHALPRDVAQYVKSLEPRPVLQLTAGEQNRRQKPGLRNGLIWIDLENTPHIPFFKPIIRELEKRGYETFITAREAFQTCEMAESYGLKFLKIGRHWGQHRLMKLLGLFVRAAQLLPHAARNRPLIGLNHGSRTQILACNLLRIPTVLIMDYEHARSLRMLEPTWRIYPNVVSLEGLTEAQKQHFLHYRGIKEDVYAPEFKPDSRIITELQLRGNVIATVRPPANEAHYHNPESDMLFKEVMARIHSSPGVQAVLLPRNKNQALKIKNDHPEWFQDGKVVIPDGVVDGLNLVWHSDLVISGGGTMNREAAALGVPVYSVFRGPKGAVDRHLESTGRLIMIESREAVHHRIVLAPRDRTAVPVRESSKALCDILEHLDQIVEHHFPRSR